MKAEKGVKENRKWQTENIKQDGRFKPDDISDQIKRSKHPQFKRQMLSEWIKQPDAASGIQRGLVWGRNENGLGRRGHVFHCKTNLPQDAWPQLYLSTRNGFYL